MRWRTRKRGTKKQRGIRFKSSRGGSLGARVRLLSEEMRGKEDHSYLKFDKKYNYWSVPGHLVRGGIEWGFDLSGAPKGAWNRFLQKHGFIVVDEAPKSYKGPAIYKNPNGVILVMQYSEHGNRARGEKGRFLGYMRFEAPKSQSKELKKILLELV